MNSKFLLTLAICCWAGSLKAQTDSNGNYRNFPLVITIQFHNFSLPFRDMKSNFSNIGIGLGTEFSLNGKPNWVQQLNVAWYHNKVMGNGLLFYTQNAWRPYFTTNAYTEIKGGVGYLHSFRPTESFQQVNGNWISVEHKGKGMLTIPVGASLGYEAQSVNTYISNFASYQFLLVKDYNQSIPLVPETLVQVGSRIHFK